jgi:hypothetical protein
MKRIIRFLKKRLSDHRLIYYAMFIILFGSLLITLSLLGEEAWKTHSQKIFLKFVEHVGVALLSIGAIGLLLEIPDMSNYFQKKIAKTIVQRDYLGTLERNELQTLQGHVLKAIYILDDVNHEDTLLEYCQQKIHGYIADPYREDVLGVFKIDYTPDKKKYEIQETISYTCRAINQCIQDAVRWTMEKGEISELINFEITLTFPQEEFDKPEFRKRHSCLKDLTEPEIRVTMKNDKYVEKGVKNKKNVNAVNDFWEDFWAWYVKYLGRKEEEPFKWKEYTKGEGFSLGLEPFKDIDKVKVKFWVKYHAPLDRSSTWSMAYPSKKVIGIIVYPPETDFYLDPFGVKRGHIQTEQQGTTFTLRYDSWMLPQSGFTFHLVKRNDDQGAVD